MTDKTTVGWACFAPSGAISWRSVETSKSASIAAACGERWPDVWPTFESAGWRCEAIEIKRAEDQR